MNRDEINELFGVTDAQLDEWARPFEDGTWEGVEIGEVRLGRPVLYDEEMSTVSFRPPLSKQEAVESACRDLGITKSEFYRQAVDEYLKKV